MKQVSKLSLFNLGYLLYLISKENQDLKSRGDEKLNTKLKYPFYLASFQSNVKKIIKTLSNITDTGPSTQASDHMLLIKKNA
jgi:hypothetical protein